ncbi:hypothetical protein FZC76_12855 [Sutcliffiella horikoshii]|uniref:Uncharacterized protein n=1 Tax=Sutcliffiella horikoshii TaxID=79883 RepID=A0A5D4SXT2_9BACI|nr:hypothetical protein [Sutcliffiella horikoshii]TYS67471.1 hypothetical protein FZC76_12855 [Sutcliffiella horikoshii]
MFQQSSKQYYILVFLLVIAVFYGFQKHVEVNKQQDFLEPHLKEMVGNLQLETNTTSVIMQTVMNENEIPYAQWVQLKNGFKTIEDASYEIEKLAKAIYPRHSDGLQFATKTSANLIAGELRYLEDTLLEEDMDRLDTVTFPKEMEATLVRIHDTVKGWNDATSPFIGLPSNLIDQTDWVELLKEMEDDSIAYQESYGN